MNMNKQPKPKFKTGDRVWLRQIKKVDGVWQPDPQGPYTIREVRQHWPLTMADVQDVRNGIEYTVEELDPNRRMIERILFRTEGKARQQSLFEAQKENAK